MVAPSSVPGSEPSGAPGKRQLDGVDDPVVEQVLLRGLELLGVLLGLAERAQIGLELGANRCLDGRRALLLEDRREGHPRLELADHVFLGRAHRQLARLPGEDLVDDGGAVMDALLRDRRGDLLAVGRVEPLGDRPVEPLRLAGAGAELLLGLAELDDLGVSELEGLEQRLLGHLVGTGLDHGQAVLRADDDEVERALLLALGQRRVDDELAVDQPDADGADRAEERHRRDHERRRDAVDREDVVRGDHVGREHGGDALHLVAEALRPERPDRAVDHAGRQDRPLGGPPFALEEAAGDLPGRIHPLLDIDREREEILALAGLGPALRRGEDHGLARADDDCAVCLLGELARLEGDVLPADGHGHGNRRRLLLGFNDCHSLILH